MGKVVLAGVGCGEADLMSIRAWDFVERADCILYDHLMDAAILKAAKPGCVKIFVGKESGNHAVAQDQINAMLVDFSTQYDCVVRLKGGDPYVFGRGAEEAHALLEAGVPFEVVPGISSCIAGLSFAGIPITARSITRGFRVYTAHSSEDRMPELDFEQLAFTKDTVVFLMGRKNLARIVEGYQKAGAPDLPIALISKAGFPEQRVCVGTLSTIVEQCAREEYPAPALIVVGNVVNESEALNWFSRRPLSGKTVLYARNSDRDDLLEPLRDLGAIVDAPVAFERVESPEMAVDVEKYDWVVLTSQTAIRLFMERMRRQQVDVRRLPKVAVVHEQSAQALARYGVFADLVGTKDAESLVKQLNQVVDADSNILVPHSAANIDVFVGLKGNVDVHVLYQMVPLDWHASRPAYDYGVFTSARMAESVLARGVRIGTAISIGEKTTAALRKGGVKTICQAKRPCYGDMLEILKGNESCIEAED